MLKFLRSAPIMARIVLAGLMIFLYCCNPVKKVLNDSDKTQQVVNKYLETHPARTDTFTRVIPGDTITQLIVGYDTTVLHDTVNNHVSVTKTITKIVTRVDTIERRIIDNKLLQACQDGLAKVDYDKKQAVLDKQAAESKANGWRLKFWVVVLIMTIGIGALIFLRR